MPSFLSTSRRNTHEACRDVLCAVGPQATTELDQKLNTSDGYVLIMQYSDPHENLTHPYILDYDCSLFLKNLWINGAVQIAR